MDPSFGRDPLTSTAYRGGRHGVAYTRYETHCPLRLYLPETFHVDILDEVCQRNAKLDNAKILAALIYETEVDEILSWVFFGNSALVVWPNASSLLEIGVRT